MPGSAQDYVSVSAFQMHRTHAFKVWAWTLGIAAFWLALMILPPVMQNGHIDAIASPIYHFFSYTCHQMPERSLHLMGYPLAVCSRCFGIYLGLLSGIAAYPVWRSIDNTEPLPRFWLFLALVPIGIDWSLTAFGIWENTHLSRLVTGAILGAACATFIVPGVVEIFRNLSRRGRSRT